MHPAGKVHLTSGILPRKALALARDWVAPGLARDGAVGAHRAGAHRPRRRSGCPKVVGLPERPALHPARHAATWQDDPILAATQTALLPDLPHEVQEGYIRVAPDTRLRGAGA